MEESGKQLSFWELLQESTQIVIPIIQRDYAQGRIDPKGQNLCREVREGFVDELKKALVENKPLVLDYIYGSWENGFFYPVDGQQRLTTLFLLHWYIGVKENKLDDSFKATLKKFSYATRDTAKEFCASLCDMFFDFSTIQNLSEEIKNDVSYFHVYNYDPTVQAMLVMLDRIHLEFKDIKESLWGRLKNITFWCLHLEQFGLTDDLFVKMNARGKRLSRFDLFKAELEAAMDKRLKEEPSNKKLTETVERWKTNIDNSYLDGFWKVYGKNGAERNIFRLLIFTIKCLNPSAKEYDELWERQDLTASYKEEVEMVAADENLIEILCDVLETFPQWKTEDPSVEFLLPKDFHNPKGLLHHQRVILFGVIYWHVLNKTTTHENFDKFYRILYNLIYANREYNNKTRQFYSSIDGRRFYNSISTVKKIIEDFHNSSYKDFYDYIRHTTSEQLQYERQKLEYNDLDEIQKLEGCSALGHSIQNFFFDNKIYIKAQELDQILKDNRNINLCLRIILSFAEDRFGSFIDLVFDGTNMQSGKRQLYYNSPDDKATAYCHKYSIKESGDGFGDKVLSADNRDSLKYLSKAVKEFAKQFYLKFYEQGQGNVRQVLQKILQERLKLCDFSNTESILWYIVKYEEFFYALKATTFLVLRRKQYGFLYDDDNVYDIRCTDSDFDVSNTHYQPFYVALCHYLNSSHSTITIDEKILKIKGNQIEYAHPCKLSNGWVVRIEHGGDWKIAFKGIMPKKSIRDKYKIDDDATEYVLKNNKTDCIELLGNFILECM